MNNHLRHVQHLSKEIIRARAKEKRRSRALRARALQNNSFGRALKPKNAVVCVKEAIPGIYFKAEKSSEDEELYRCNVEVIIISINMDHILHKFRSTLGY